MEYEEGADIIRWMKEELVDIAVPTVPVAAVEGVRHLKQYLEAGRDCACAVFAGTRNPNHDDLTRRPITREILRAQLCLYARAGVDGVYHWWPRIDPDHANWEMLREFGDPGAMARGDKHYIASENLPLVLQPGENKVPFLVADDLHSALAGGILREVRLRLRLLHLRPEDKLSLRLNGEPIPQEAFIAPLHPAALWAFGRLDAVLQGEVLPVKGENELTVVVEKRDPMAEQAPADQRRIGELILRNVELTIRYHQSRS